MILDDLDKIERLGDSWRFARADMADCILWIREALKHGEAPSKIYEKYYLQSLRLAMRAEEKMTILGVEFEQGRPI